MKIIISILIISVTYFCYGKEALTVIKNNPGNKSKNIVFIGDSISRGVGASSYGNRYTTLVTNFLNKQQYEFKEKNLAISGSTLVDQAWPSPNASAYPHVLGKVISAKPDIVIIQHGTNDNAVGCSLAQFFWSYRQLVRTIKEKLPKTKIVCMTICPSWKAQNSNKEWLNRANIGIQEIAALENTLLAHTNFALKNRKELFPDGIHPNDKGHKIIAESIIKALSENKLKTKQKFDFISNGSGQYRICNYVFDIRSKNNQNNNSWVCFYDVSKTGFRYISDYIVHVASPWKLYANDITIKAGDKNSNIITAKNHNKYTGYVVFSLIQNKDKEIKINILPKRE